MATSEGKLRPNSAPPRSVGALLGSPRESSTRDCSPPEISISPEHARKHGAKLEPHRIKRRVAHVPTLNLSPSRAELFDFRYLMGRSSARIALFEIDPLISGDLSRTELADQFWRAESRLIDANETFFAAYGATAVTECVGKPFAFFFPPTEQHRSMILNWCHEGFVLGHFALATDELDGSNKSFSAAIYAVDERSDVRRFWIVLRDVTALASALNAVTAQERYFRGLVETSGFFMMRVNAMGHPLYVSPSLEDLVGFPAREFEQNPHLYRSIIHPDDQEGYDLILAARYATLSKTVEAEYRILCKDGTYRWMFERQTRNDSPASSANSSEETATGVTSFDSLIFDIQDRKLLEAELRHTQRIDMVGQLAGGVAHDFNNYLTAILGQIKLSLLEVPRGSTTHERLLATEQATLRCAEMTKQLLSLSRKDQLSLKPVSVAQLVDSTAALCHHLLPPAICLSVSHAPGTLQLLGDAGQLQQVLMNLIINSRDAISGVGSIALATKERIISPEAATVTLPAGRFVQIDVTDSGSGISVENLKHIFEPFFTTKSAGQGTGLGLSLVFSIIRNHGGAIDVSSEVGKGTRISMLIPATTPSGHEDTLSSPIGFAIPTLDAGEELLEEPRYSEVLVVEDEPLVRSVIKASLLGSGYGVYEVGDAESGLELLRKFPGRFRLVIIDQSLPGMSGRELVAKLRGLGDSTPLLLTTGMPWFEGAPVTPGDPHEVIVKPFDPIDLISAAYRLCQELRK